MTDFRHNGVVLIGRALLKSAGMDMDICDDAPSRFSAMGPEIAESTPVDFDNTCTQRIRVDVIVEDKLFDGSRAIARAQ
ncbi:hypothetical protein WL57_25445 [Burkholderia cepacia]|nr:hypothetical protein WL57_25445 [Burkholderia cepacia]